MSLYEWLDLQVSRIKKNYTERIKLIATSTKNNGQLAELLAKEVASCKLTLSTFKRNIFQKLNTLQQKNDDSEAEKLLNELN